MEGYSLNSAPLLDNTNVDLFGDISNCLFFGKKTTTYKYGFFKAILDNVFEADNNTLSFLTLSHTFAKTYFNIINLHKIPQMARTIENTHSSISKVITSFSQENHITNSICFDSLNANEQEQLYLLSKNVMKRYVVGAFYGDTRGHLYGFSKKGETITFNEKSICFLKNHKTILDQLNYYEWLKLCEQFLNKEKRSIENLSLVLENITKRSNLSEYKILLKKFHDECQHCFYCGKEMHRRITLDHVIPWDFIKSDNPWNLVFCCPECNSSKNNKIPSQKYLNKLIKRNSLFSNDATDFSSPNINEIVAIAINNGVKYGWEP